MLDKNSLSVERRRPTASVLSNANEFPSTPRGTRYDPRGLDPMGCSFQSKLSPLRQPMTLRLMLLGAHRKQLFRGRGRGSSVGALVEGPRGLPPPGVIGAGLQDPGMIYRKMRRREQDPWDALDGRTPFPCRRRADQFHFWGRGPGGALDGPAPPSSRVRARPRRGFARGHRGCASTGGARCAFMGDDEERGLSGWIGPSPKRRAAAPREPAPTRLPVAEGTRGRAGRLSGASERAPGTSGPGRDGCGEIYRAPQASRWRVRIYAETALLER